MFAKPRPSQIKLVHHVAISSLPTLFHLCFTLQCFNNNKNLSIVIYMFVIYWQGPQLWLTMIYGSNFSKLFKTVQFVFVQLLPGVYNQLGGIAL
jgi:hypothetical protein